MGIELSLMRSNIHAFVLVITSGESYSWLSLVSVSVGCLVVSCTIALIYAAKCRNDNNNISRFLQNMTNLCHPPVDILHLSVDMHCMSDQPRMVPFPPWMCVCVCVCVGGCVGVGVYVSFPCHVPLCSRKIDNPKIVWVF